MLKLFTTVDIMSKTDKKISFIVMKSRVMAFKFSNELWPEN